MAIAETGTPIIDAVKNAINSPLLETNITGATNILLNTCGKMDIAALSDALSYVRETAGGDVNLMWGTVNSETCNEDQIIVTVIATGMPEKSIEKPADPVIDFSLPPYNPPIKKASEVRPPKPVAPEKISIPPFLQRDSFSKI